MQKKQILRQVPRLGYFTSCYQCIVFNPLAWQVVRGEPRLTEE